jgi:hypothetical protein
LEFQATNRPKNSPENAGLCISSCHVFSTDCKWALIVELSELRRQAQRTEILIWFLVVVGVVQRRSDVVGVEAEGRRLLCLPSRAVEEPSRRSQLLLFQTSTTTCSCFKVGVELVACSSPATTATHNDNGSP